jgi:F-type H+-transporting ATPase subunit b
MSKYFRIYFFATGLLLASGLVFAQSTPQSQPSSSSVLLAQAPSIEKLDQRTEEDLRKASLRAGRGHGSEDTEEAEENAQFKYAAVVRWVAAKTGLSKEVAYWLFMIINFVILAGFVRWVIKKMLPDGFVSRNAEIQKGIAEARRASAEANARLKEIEGRLAKLDAEISEIRTAAEGDFSHEEQRIKEAAEQDAKNVIIAAEQEIAAATRLAQRELKSFVADLAVGLAEKKIKVDEATDKALVRSFASQIGKDGQ